MRSLLVLVWVFLGFIVVSLIWPAVWAYTMLEGERAIASVEECHDKFSRLDREACTGTWKRPGGAVQAGRIHGVDSEDVGDVIEVRLGPLAEVRFGIFGGAWADDSGPSPSALGFAITAVIMAGILTFYVGRFALINRSLRKRGMRGGGTVLLAGRHELRTIDGSFRAHVNAPREGVPPPSAAHLPPAHLDQPRFREVRTSDDRVLFYLKDSRDRERHTELTVLGHDGRVLVVMRRLPPWRKPKRSEKAGVGPRYGLESSKGRTLGMIRQRLESKAAHTLAFTVIDPDGRRLVDAAPGFRHWVVWARPAAPAEVVHAAIALLYSGFKMP